MTKLLNEAIARVRKLPEEEQDSFARVLLSMADMDASAFPIDAETEVAIRQGLAEAERGEFVADEVVTAADKRRGL
jgi:predicted transcriptional regulator